MDALEFETKRLKLRPHRLADAPRLQELCGNWKVASMLARVPHPYPDGLAEEWIASHDAHRAERGAFPFAVEFEGELVGTTGLDRLDDGSYEAGYWIGEPWWGRGFASEAGAATIDFAFTELGVPLLRAGHFTDNPASGRVLEKLGFEFTGMEGRWCEARQRHVASREMELSRERWTVMKEEGTQ